MIIIMIIIIIIIVILIIIIIIKIIIMNCRYIYKKFSPEDESRFNPRNVV